MKVRLGRVTINAQVTPKPGAQTLVFPEDVMVGDRVLVECEVTNYQVYGDPKHRHVIVRPARESYWVAGDQELWTYGWRQKGETEPRIWKVIR